MLLQKSDATRGAAKRQRTGVEVRRQTPAQDRGRQGQQMTHVLPTVCSQQNTQPRVQRQLCGAVLRALSAARSCSAPPALGHCAERAHRRHGCPCLADLVLATACPPVPLLTTIGGLSQRTTVTQLPGSSATSPQVRAGREQRAWDSNPRAACTPPGFQDRRHRPPGAPGIAVCKRSVSSAEGSTLMSWRRLSAQTIAAVAIVRAAIPMT